MADEQLLKDAGIRITPKSIIVHFYAKPVVETLARTEIEFKKRPLADIARTYFSVRPKGTGFEFVVTRMTYKN